MEYSIRRLFFFFFLMVEGKGNEIYSKVSNKIGEDKLRR